MYDFDLNKQKAAHFSTTVALWNEKIMQKPPNLYSNIFLIRATELHVKPVL